MNPKSRDDGTVERDEFRGTQRADEIRQAGLRKTKELVTMDAAVVHESFFDADGHLRGQSVAQCVDGGAHECRELRVDQDLTADDGENSRLLGVAR